MKEAIPAHVGIIMDGNGRWAKSRGLPRTDGHVEGLEAAKRAVAYACARGIRYLSLYAFSTENWKRAKDEVGFLMSLITRHLIGEMAFYREHDVRLLHSGNRDGLSLEVRREIDRAVMATKEHGGTTVNLAINYGGRDEIARAAASIVADGRSVTEKELEERICGAGVPALDLVIRSGGDMRLSNFMIWQSAYAELYFSDVLWPDWSDADFDGALGAFASRERRYGGTGQ